MTYDPAWRFEDQRRIEWLERLYRMDGRNHPDHSKAGTYTGLIERFGPIPWK